MKEKPSGEGRKSFPFFVSIWILFFMLPLCSQSAKAQRADEEKLTRYDQLAAEATLLNQRAQYDRVLALLQPRQNDPQNDSALFFNELAIAYQHLGRLPRAAQAFRQALDRDPENPVIHNNLGYVFYLQKDYPRAVEEYQKVLDSSPRFKEAHANLALAYYQQKRYPQALAEIEVVLKLDPNYQAAEKFRKKILNKLKEEKGSPPSR
jgi:tetratricopeptide (TPR) repeat protein